MTIQQLISDIDSNKILFESNSDLDLKLKSGCEAAKVIFTNLHFDDRYDEYIETALHYIKGGYSQPLKKLMKSADAHQRDIITSMIDPKLWADLGTEPMDIDKSIKRYEAADAVIKRNFVKK